MPLHQEQEQDGGLTAVHQLLSTLQKRIGMEDKVVKTLQKIRESTMAGLSPTARALRPLISPQQGGQPTSSFQGMDQASLPAMGSRGGSGGGCGGFGGFGGGGGGGSGDLLDPQMIMQVLGFAAGTASGVPGGGAIGSATGSMLGKMIFGGK